MPDLLSPIFAHDDRTPILTPREWEDALGQARRTDLLARLAIHFNDRHWTDRLPAEPRPYLIGALRLVDRQAREVRWELEQIRLALAGLQSPVVVLKGAAYLAAGLPPSRGRLFSDIDILVAREKISDAEGALMAAGWLPEKLDAYDEQYYRKWMHEIPPLIHLRRRSVIDLHHTIAPPTSRYKIDEKVLIARAVPLTGWDGLFVLSPEDMILHSAVHLFQEGEFDRGLRDLLDMNDLLRLYGAKSDFWQALLTRSRELKLQVPLHHALFHVARLFGTIPPVEVSSQVAALRSPGLASVAMARTLALALRPAHPTCDTWQAGLARWLLYVRSHYLRMPVHQAVPHLLRKAWMRRFPKPAAESEA